MKKLFELSIETQRLAALFAEMAVGEVISFKVASARMAFTVKSGLPAYAYARHIVLRDHGIVIEGIRGVGFTRLDGSGMVGKGHRSMAGIRRAAHRGSAVVTAAIRQNLTRAEMLDATEQFSRFHIIETTSNLPTPKTNRPDFEDPPSASPTNNVDMLRTAIGK